jgi:N-acetylmuramoyl-L-alanine amidase
LIFLSCLLFAVPSTCLAGENAAEVPSKRQLALNYFDQAIQIRTFLESRPKRMRTATEYLKVISRFRSVYYTYPGSSKSDESLMAVAELYQMMSSDLKEPKYLYEAIKTYDFLEDQYPGSPFCPDAQFASAEIYLNDLNDPKTAQDIFRDFLKRYPDSTKVRDARARLDDLREQLKQAKKPPPKPGPNKVRLGSSERVENTPLEIARKAPLKIGAEGLKSPESDAIQAKSPSPASVLAQNSEKSVHIRNIRFWSAEQYTRFVVETDSKAEAVDGTLDNPDRIFLDIQNAQLAPELMGKSFSLGSGPLRQLRCGQAKERVARLVFDMSEIEKYHVSRMQSPHRIVLDVKSSQSVQQQASAKLGLGSKQAKQGEPLGDELQLVSGFEAAVVLGPKKVSPAKSSVGEKEDGSKIRSADQETRMEIPPKRSPSMVNAAARQNTVRAGDELKTPTIASASREAKPKSDGTLSLIRTLGLKIGRIVIDPGHGGDDNGTVGPSGLVEKELVLDVAFRLKKLVEEKLNGEVIMTRTDDTFVQLEERTTLANESQADLFISIHANSSPNRWVSGVETFFLNFANSADVEEIAARENAGSQKTIFELQDLVQKIALKEKVDESREFAQTIQKSMAAQVQKARASAKDRGVKQAPFIVLIGANMPSILSEISFVSNPSDEKLLKSAGFRQKIAEALCHGIEDYSRNLSGVKTARNIGPTE